MTKKLGWGILSTGRIAGIFAQGLARAENLVEATQNADASSTKSGEDASSRWKREGRRQELDRTP